MAVSLQAQILALRTAVEAALGGADEGGAEVPWSPGQRLTAQVEAELPGGRYQIRIGTFQFDVELPVRAQVGDALRLEFLSASPRVAFGLTPDAQEPAPRGAPADRSPQVQISAAGRVLTQTVLAAVTAARAAPTPAAVLDPSPLLPAPPGQAAPLQSAAPLLAAALKSALARSGLFYESHLVQWFKGERPLAELLREPQGRLSTVAHLPPHQAPDESDPAQPRADPALSRAYPAAASQAALPPRVTAEEVRTAPQALDPQVLGQVRSQLDVIEQRQVLWQGQAWPGQALEWRIEDPPPRDAAQDEPTPWTTHLRLSLPRLGEVRAEINLSAGRVRVHLAAQAQAPAGALRAAQNQLNQALSQAGLVLAGFAVTSDDAA
jgi:flagellar hook-length control protein FliK